MEEERDLVVFSDDEGNEFELEVVDYFEHEEQEYAILIDPSTYENEDEEAEVYIMKVVVNGEYEEFLPADEDRMDALSAIVEKIFEEWEKTGDACGCGCGESDCEHEHGKDHDCGCGCGEADCEHEHGQDHDCGCGCEKA